MTLNFLIILVIIALAAWLGNSVLSVSSGVAGNPTPVPSAPSSSEGQAGEETAPPADGPAPTIVGASVYNPFGEDRKRVG